MTADKDDPRFDGSTAQATRPRLFLRCSSPTCRATSGLGFETRDVHDAPVANEQYTKLYVFHEHGDSNVYPSKARFSDTYIWGENDDLFTSITRLRTFVEDTLADITGTATQWLVPPDATTLRGTAAWTQKPATMPPGTERYLFVVNYDLGADSGYFGVPALPADAVLVPLFDQGQRPPAGRSDPPQWLLPPHPQSRPRRGPGVPHHFGRGSRVMEPRTVVAGAGGDDALSPRREWVPLGPESHHLATVWAEEHANPGRSPNHPLGRRA